MDKFCSIPVWDQYYFIVNLFRQDSKAMFLTAKGTSILYFEYHEDLEKHGGCGVMARGRYESHVSQITPFFYILMVQY